MEESRKLWYFSNFNMLSALSQDEKMRISEMSKMKESSAKEIIYFSDDKADSIYFLKHGKVKISNYSEDGKEMILSVLGPGELFGETGVLGTSDHGAVAEVLEDAIICSLSIPQLNSMLTKNEEFNLSISKMIGLKYRKIQLRLESLVFKTAPERIRSFIKEMADDYGKKLVNNSEIEVKLKLKHDDIAKLTATTRQSVTSELNKLEKEKVIVYDRKRILIKDYSSL